MTELIKVLKDTFFHKTGVKLTFVDFKKYYGSYYNTTINDDIFLNHMKTEKELLITMNNNSVIINIKDWFQIIEIEQDDLPLCFVHEDLWYVKGFDGMYTAFVSPMFKEKWINSNKNNSDSIKRILITEAKILIQESKYKNNVLVCTNYVNKQMK